MTLPRDELLQLVDRQIEDRLDDSDLQRLTDLLKGDAELVAAYTEYVCIHGQLHWDAGLSASSASLVAPPSTVASDAVVAVSRQQTGNTAGSKGRISQRIAAVAATVVALLGGWLVISKSTNSPIAVNQPQHDTVIEIVNKATDPTPSVAVNDDLSPGPELKPLIFKNAPLPAPETDTPSVAIIRSRHDTLPADFSNDMVVRRINELLTASWTDQNIQPSPPASASEWVRRVYLTFMGRVPTLQETETFLSNATPRRRHDLIDQVTADPERASHLAVVWTNLLVGRTQRIGVNREKLFDFLSAQFSANAPWIETVDELITATGRNDENGATNFLLAHLNNEATPATAVTARLFLGEQISCVQCHDHPFAKDVRQQKYWALNAFFKDTDRVTASVADASVNRNMSDVPWRLVDRPTHERMTYFETRDGLKKAVLPAYDGTTMTPDSQENRRQELARLLATDSESRVAEAMVNRMWAHFFGYGFTNPVDDMGAHATVSHPELLDVLTEAFVKSNYDLQRLMQWIAGSQAWQLSSETAVANSVDDPAAGEVPQFSRVYVRRMTPEQVYESIRVAVRSAAGQPVEDSEVHSGHRRQWVRQFAQAYDTDENDESLDFEGTIAQAMVMMNGAELDQAIHQATQAIVEGSARPSASGVEALHRVALAMVTRRPTPREEAVFRKHYRGLTQQDAAGALPQAVEDMMWAYLNSSEFVLVH